jgi:hypothetical protein
MRLTPAHRKQINAAARWTCNLHHCEVGAKVDQYTKHGEWKFNTLFLTDPDSEDLGDIYWLRDVKEIEDHPSGRAELDVYVYARTRWGDQELHTNIAVEFVGTEIVAIYEPMGTRKRMLFQAPVAV